MRLKCALFALVGLLLALPTGFAQSKTQASLVLADEVVRPGDTVLAGVRLRMADGWHTYWQNSGESGGATEIEWVLPAGVKAGAIQWPVPEKLVEAEVTTYVLHGEALLMVPLNLAPSVPKGPLTIKARVRWLECSDLCLPGKAELEAALTVGETSKPSKDAPLFEAAKKRLPQKKPASFAQAWWEQAATGDKRPALFEWAPAPETVETDFIPVASEKFTLSGATEKAPAPSGKVRLRKVVEKMEGGWPSQIGGLLMESGAGGKLLAAYEVTLPVGAKAPGGTTASAAPPTPEAKLGTGALLLNLAFAFIGGLILNLMPCVLPVIALKVLSFVSQSGGSAAERRRLGLIYALGVLVSLLALAGLVIAVQQAGRAASWGMQFQNPQFVIVITTVVTLVALNLFGVFEVNLGGGMLGTAGTLAAREGAPGAFFNGVLAVVLATPCTAPFLATALGVAFTQPPVMIAMFFAAVAAGLAFPYVMLSFFPALLRFLPKPGAWMERFKNAMGFPMLAVAVWLLTLTAPHYGNAGVLWVGLFLVALAIAAWVWGQFVQRGSGNRGLAMTIAALVLAGGYLYALEVELRWRAPVPMDKSATPLQHGKDGIPWQAWSTPAVEAARAEGRPVLVDFTADWCLTCQANKKTSLEIPSVREKLKAINAVALLGDYTREDPAIAVELRRFGRAGVPLVLVYPKNPARSPIVLPALLTPSIVLNALDKAAQ